MMPPVVIKDLDGEVNLHEETVKGLMIVLIELAIDPYNIHNEIDLSIEKTLFCRSMIDEQLY